MYDFRKQGWLENVLPVFLISKKKIIVKIYNQFHDNEMKLDKHNAELQRADPGTKVMGYFSTRGRIFPHDAQNEFSLFPSF